MVTFTAIGDVLSIYISFRYELAVLSKKKLLIKKKMHQFSTYLVALVTIVCPVYSKPVSSARTQGELIESCPSLVYCQGSLLDTIQKFKIFRDSKTFVDMSQKNPEDVTLDNFSKMMKTTNNSPNKQQVTKFVSDNFLEEDETEMWSPMDFTSNPSMLRRIPDPFLRRFAQTLVSFWPNLGRKIKSSVRKYPKQHSLIPVPNGFIVPGGRFREIYYWDSYWIIKGLLISEMHNTAKGMLENFIYLIRTYGLIPNGSRIYYLNRSQPPLFTMMVGLYLEYTNDVDWLRHNIKYIDDELVFWIEKRTVSVEKNGVTYQLAHYAPKSDTPRPESYSEDLETCGSFKTEDAQKICYNSLKAGAETGWDFSTRWFFDEQGSANTNLTHSDSQRVIPVDLNSFLCKSFTLLSEFYSKIGDTQKQQYWKDYSQKWMKNIEEVMYHKQDGIWYDYDRVLKKPRTLFFPSNFAPLWTESYNLTLKSTYGEKSAGYFYAQGLHQYQGGIPTSLADSGEQWDLPNAWPPLQEFVILGLQKTGNGKARKIASSFAEKWILANLKGFDQSGAMYEKYDAIESGLYGGGGEYEVQEGFGWTNGVVLSLIDEFYTSSGFSLTILSGSGICGYVFFYVLLLLYQSNLNKVM